MRNFRQLQLSFILEAQLLKCLVLRIIRERQNSSWQILRCLVCFHFALISGMLRGMFSCKPYFNKKMTMVKSGPMGYLKNKTYVCIGKPSASVANSARFTERAFLEGFTSILSILIRKAVPSFFIYDLSVFPLKITSRNTNFWCVSNPSKTC